MSSDYILKVVQNTFLMLIANELRYTIPLLIEEKPLTFLTVESHVHLQAHVWRSDYHDYVHEGARVHLLCLLNMYCYTGARLREICMGTYNLCTY